MEYALGVGLTSACTFACRHCYSGGGAAPVYMDTELLFRFLRECPVASVNLGTGESALHPEFHSVLNRLHGMGIPVALTTAGPSVEALTDSELSLLHDVDFSLDFPMREAHDEWRARGAFQMVMEGLERCSELGVTASVAMCLMEQNANLMGEMCDLCGELGVSLRVNVYKPVISREYQPSYGSFWKAVNTLFRSSARAVSSEPIVNAALQAVLGEPLFTGQGSPCGRASLRLRPEGVILPCVYWNGGDVTMKGFLEEGRVLPDSCANPLPALCADCRFYPVCRGGCAGRRLYTGLNEPDIYCFRLPGNELPAMEVPGVLSGEEYIHASYLCTMIAEFR